MMRLALLGHPVTGSLSPVMHRAAMAAVGIDGEYELVDVPAVPSSRLGESLPAELPLGEFLERARGYGYRGFNVTAPHKVAALGLCGSLSREARLAGAVNTILVGGPAGLEGHNTDVPALRGFMEEWARGGAGRGFGALILGAGGAAAAAAVAAVEAGAGEVILAGRSVGKARRVAARLREGLARRGACGGESSPRVTAVSLDQVLGGGCEAVGGRVVAGGSAASGGSALGRAGRPVAEVVVQATSAPDGELGGYPGWRPGSLAIELNYRPLRTRFLSGAARAGASCVDGLEVLLAQGEEAFRLFTGLPAPAGVMRRALEEEVTRRGETAYGG